MKVHSHFSMEQDTKFYFDTDHFQDLFSAGSWDECRDYLKSFVSYSSDSTALKVYFEISKQKYLQQLYKYVSFSFKR